jgi:hypothetical protein
MSFGIKDSGVRETYATGMVRDTQDGKPDYTLVDYPMLTRWAKHVTLGAEKYGRRNWQLASTEEELERFRSSAFRHFVQWITGDTDEDHAAAVYFNIAAAEMVTEKLKNINTIKDHKDEEGSSNAGNWAAVGNEYLNRFRSVSDNDSTSIWADSRND